MGSTCRRPWRKLQAQTWFNLEVIVVDDGSSCLQSRQTFDQSGAGLYPRFRFVRQANAGCGAARNTALALAEGEFFVPVDADNLFKPEMIGHVQQWHASSPDTACLTCYFLAFQEDRDLQVGRFTYAYQPPGGPATVAGFENVYGDTNAMP